MVDPLFVYMGGSLGGGHDASAEDTRKGKASCVYDNMRGTRFFVRNFICSGSGNSLWIEFSGDDSLDRGGASVGLHSWYQQFFLRDINCAGNFSIEIGGKKRDGYGLENVEVKK